MADTKKKNTINVLVTGSNGQLGKSLNYVKKKSSIYNLIFTSKKKLDITNYSKVENFLKRKKIKIIINAAAYTNVDLAQKKSKDAYQVNYYGVKILAILSNKYNIILIHISTDYVFDGNKKTPYIANDNYAPKSIYGKSKLKGDKSVIKYADKYLIIRLAWLYGPFGNNFFTKIIKKFFDNKFYQIVTNQYAYPASSIQLSKDILILIPILLKNRDKKKYFGIFNYGPYQYRISRYIFVSKLSKLILKNTSLINKYKLNKKIVTNKFNHNNKKTISDIRPSNSMLINKPFFDTFNIKKQSFDKSLKLSLSIYLNNITK